MKSTFTSLLFLFTVTLATAQEFKTPVDYLNYIGKEILDYSFIQRKMVSMIDQLLEILKSNADTK